MIVAASDWFGLELDSSLVELGTIAVELDWFDWELDWIVGGFDKIETWYCCIKELVDIVEIAEEVIADKVEKLNK